MLLLRPLHLETGVSQRARFLSGSTPLGALAPAVGENGGQIESGGELATDLRRDLLVRLAVGQEVVDREREALAKPRLGETRGTRVAGEGPGERGRAALPLDRQPLAAGQSGDQPSGQLQPANRQPTDQPTDQPAWQSAQQPPQQRCVPVQLDLISRFLWQHQLRLQLCPE